MLVATLVSGLAPTEVSGSGAPGGAAVQAASRTAGDAARTAARKNPGAALRDAVGGGEEDVEHFPAGGEPALGIGQTERGSRRFALRRTQSATSSRDAPRGPGGGADRATAAASRRVGRPVVRSVRRMLAFPGRRARCRAGWFPVIPSPPQSRQGRRGESPGSRSARRRSNGSGTSAAGPGGPSRTSAGRTRPCRCS